MKLLTLWLAPAILLSSQERFARLSEWEGSAEIQVDPADSWEPALRNMPVPELAWLRTGASSRLELELDEGSVLRVGPESLVELSDYTRLSTGQRVTLISLDRGLAYFTGEAQGADAMVLAVPGAQITVTRHTRLRLRAGTNSSAIAVLEGAARFSCPTAELELREEQMVQVDPAQTARFSLYREVPPAELDDWSRARDQALSMVSSAAHVPGLRYGWADLDAHGTWIEAAGFGTVWKPKAAEGWAPYRNGKWRWYDELGYTWIGAEPWGWLPYHHGRWMQETGTGWFWVPGTDTDFEPGEVYWLYGRDLA